MSKKIKEQLYVVAIKSIKKPVEANRLTLIEKALNKALSKGKLKEDDVDLMFKMVKKTMRVK